MPFASINPTNPRTNLWNFCEKILRIGDFEKWAFFESAILNFFFEKNNFLNKGICVHLQQIQVNWNIWKKIPIDIFFKLIDSHFFFNSKYELKIIYCEKQEKSNEWMQCFLFFFFSFYFFLMTTTDLFTKALKINPTSKHKGT